MTTGDSEYPVSLEVGYPEAPSRVWALLGVLFLIKGLALIPHVIAPYFLSIVGFILMYIGYWAVLITGSYPRGLFNVQVGIQRWSMRTNAWLAGWTDRYPPFSF